MEHKQISDSFILLLGYNVERLAVDVFEPTLRHGKIFVCIKIG
jgi:hypothetical protein